MKIDKSWYVRPIENIPQRKGAGGVIVRVKNNKVYIGLVKGNGFTNYILPKGGQEGNEDLLTCAKREIGEETGITDLKLISELGVYERLTFEKDSWNITKYFLFLTDQEKGKATDPEESYIIEWFDIDNLPELFWPEQKELIEENRKKIIKLVKSLK